MEIDAGHTAQRQHQALGREKLARRDLGRKTAGRVQCGNVRDVQLVRTFAPVRVPPHTDQAAALANALDQTVEPLLRHQPFQRANSDPVVRRREVEEGHACAGEFKIRTARHSRAPRHRSECVQQQRRKAELIDGMCLVSVAEVADVLLVRHIGFRQQNGPRRKIIDQVAHQLDDRMRLGQMHARRADSLPQETDGVQANDGGPVLDVQQQDVQRLEQHVGSRRSSSRSGPR